MTQHDKIARRLARRFGTIYKSNKGIDIVTPDRVIEVEVKKGGVAQGIQQVIRSSKARYLAVPPLLRKLAEEATKGTGIGLLGPAGAILKRARRG